MIQYRDQFIAEKQIQTRQLQSIVVDLKKYSELMETTENVCHEKG